MVSMIGRGAGGRLAAILGRFAAVLSVGMATPAFASAGATEDPLWTALGLGCVILLAYGVTRVVAQPLLRAASEQDPRAVMAQAETQAWRAGADDLLYGVAVTDTDGRILYANEPLRAAMPGAMPGRPLAGACGHEGLDRLLRQVATSNAAAEISLRLPWGDAAVRCVPAPTSGLIVSFRPQRQPPAAAEARRVGAITVEPLRRHASVNGTALHLTETEFRLLAYFVERPGLVLTRESLLREVWDHKEAVYSRTVDTHVQRLRDKLGAARQQLQTVRGAGYRLQTGGQD